MFISHHVRLGYGFLVSADELQQIAEQDEELYEAFIDSKFTVCLNNYNNYTDYPTQYFFGLIIFTLNEGEAAIVPNVRAYDTGKYLEMINEFKQYCPNKKPYFPKDYVLFCVE